MFLWLGLPRRFSGGGDGFAAVVRFWRFCRLDPAAPSRVDALGKSADPDSVADVVGTIDNLLRPVPWKAAELHTIPHLYFGRA